MTYADQTPDLPFTFGIVKPQLPDITKALNEKGLEGWQLEPALLPTAQLGSSDRVVQILERAID